MKQLLYDYVPCVYSHFLTHFQAYSLIFMEMYFKIRYCGLLFSYDIKLVFICVINNGFSWCCIVSYGAQCKVALFPGLPWPPSLWWLAVWKNKSSLVPRPPFLFWEGSGNETKTRVFFFFFLHTTASNQKLELEKAWEGGYPNGVLLSCRSRGSIGFFIIFWDLGSLEWIFWGAGIACNIPTQAWNIIGPIVSWYVSYL